MNKSKEETLPLMVTIQCITYNHELYIRQCLEGFVMQQTNFRFEVIVHDDASTDSTANIIREYVEKYPDIIKPIYETENLYSKHDGSINRIMNEHTQGKYVAMCEGDDFWADPLKLQKQVDLLEHYPNCSMCCSGYIRRQVDEVDIVDSISSTNGFFFFTLEDWGKRWLTKTLTIVYRHNMLVEYIQKVDSYKYARDIHLIYHLLKVGNGIYLSEITSVYHVHLGGVCSMLPKIMKARDSYNCYKELYLNNHDETLRKSYYNSIRARLLYGDSEICLLKEGWNLTLTLFEKMQLLASLLLSSSIYFNIRGLIKK